MQAPDPIETLFSAADVIPKHNALEELRERVDAMRFCRGRSDDHAACEPFKVLDEALKLVKFLGVSPHDPMPGRKRQNVIHWLFEKFLKCDAIRDEKIDQPGFKKLLETDMDLAEYICWRLKELQVPAEGIERVKPDVPKMYWDRKNRCYCVQSDDACWQHESKEDAIERLIEAGCNPVAPKGSLSDCHQALLNIRNERPVDQMVTLAGYGTGVYEVNGWNILVPSTFKLIEPKNYKDSRCPHVFALLGGLLLKNDEGMTDEEKSDPYWHFLTWLKVSYIALRDGQLYGSIVPFLCGPPDSGKSLTLEAVVAPILGGRIGNAYLYISGQSSFNDELMGKELWIIDDGVPLSDYTARRRFGGLLKQAVAGNSVPCHAKGKAQMTLPLYRRLVVALNPEDMETLPPLAESLGDKYMLLKTNKFPMPEDCLPLPGIKDRPAFLAKIKEEQSYFLGWLLEQDLSAYSARRFGVVAYKDAELIADHADASGLDTKYAVVCELLFNGRGVDAVEMKTSEIWIKMMGHFNNSLARETFKNDISLGMALSALAGSTSHRELVTKRVLDGYAHWTIRQNRVSSDAEGSPVRHLRSTGIEAERQRDTDEK